MLKTVKVPKQFEARFKKAEKVVESFFDKKEFDVSKATIKISGERYLLIRASSLSVDFFECVRDLYRDKESTEAINVTRQILFDIGHAIGMKDAEHFHKKMNLVDPLDKLSAGPAHFSYTGWAFIEISSESILTADENFLRVYDYKYSFEAESWINAGKKTDIPVCIMASGYSSGWNEQSFGIPLVATELTCKAKGDETCHFVMAHPSRIENYIKDDLRRDPKLAKTASNYEIPGFFKLKIAEAALKEANTKLTDANVELIERSTALEEKTLIMELLSEMGKILPTCITHEEIYAVFFQYASKLLLNLQGKLFIYTEDRTQLEVVSSWGKSQNEERIISSSDCWALRRGQPYLVQDPLLSGSRCHHTQNAEGGSLCIPIIAGGEIFGLMSINFGISDFSQDDQSIVTRLAGDVALALANVRLRESLHELSIRDYLTGLHNRRYMEEILVKEVANAKRHESSLGVIMFDIDYFKKFNDTFGHEAGDAVLSALGGFLKDNFREGDVLCRFGGEEFFIILINTSSEATLEKAEFLRQNVKKLQVKNRDQNLGEIHISLGVALFPEHGETARILVDAADKALYHAKRAGRDRVCLAVKS